MVQLCIRISPVLAQADKETQEIKTFIGNFLQNYSSGNLNSTISDISTHFLDISIYDNSEIDYARFLAILEKRRESLSKRYIDMSINNLQMLKTKKQNNTIKVSASYTWKAFDSKTDQYVSLERNVSCSLVKENGLWKIVRWHSGPAEKSN